MEFRKYETLIAGIGVMGADESARKREQKLITATQTQYKDFIFSYFP